MRRLTLGGRALLAATLLPAAGGLQLPCGAPVRTHRAPPPRAMAAGDDVLADLQSRARDAALGGYAHVRAVVAGTRAGGADDAGLRLVRLCDRIDDAERRANYGGDAGSAEAARELGALHTERRWMLGALLRSDQEAYLHSVNFLRDRIPRAELPSILGVAPPTAIAAPPAADAAASTDADGEELVPECTVEEMEYAENPLDVALLWIFRKLVQSQIGWASPDPGFAGLVEEGRYYMQKGTPEQQQAPWPQSMVYYCLASLLTPVMPLVYKPFMSGQIGERNLGPWFYAPGLTALVTPPFFNFLVGPSTPTLRRDGTLGGLRVEKCRFLQDSNCKGICMQMCKLPAQQFFKEGLGMPLTVTPIFETQECQWNFGEEPLPPDEDPLLPGGCISGCTTRAAMAEAGTSKSVCL